MHNITIVSRLGVCSIDIFSRHHRTFERLIGFCQWTRDLDLGPKQSKADHVRQVVRHTSVRIGMEELLDRVYSVELHGGFRQHHQVLGPDP